MHGPSSSLVPWAGAVLLILASVGCECAGDLPEAPCTASSECGPGQQCEDGICVATEDGGGGGVRDSATILTCDDDRDPCGIGSSAACCAAEQECFAEACVIACEVENRCGAAGELCCTSNQACLSGDCADLGDDCLLTEDCEVDEICLASLGSCVPRDAVEVCEFRPPVGVFTPVTSCQWHPAASDPDPTWDDVVMTPSVANLTDDNGDGVTDTGDIPDIVFISFDRQVDGCCTSRGRLRIVSGLCNEDGTMRTIATISSPFIGNSSGIALGNLDPDTMPDEHPPEIVATMQGGGTIAWRRTADDGSAWAEIWNNVASPTAAQSSAGAQPSLADLNKDGRPEVIIGNVVLDGLSGAVVWDGDLTVGTSAGVGNNAFLGPTSTVADLNLDGFLEVIAGNTVYNGLTGAEIWTFNYTTSNSGCAGTVPCDGYNGVGDFDGDPEGEVVIVRRGEVFVLNHDGSELYRVPIPVVSCGNNESGPPTIADFDGDGRPEIGTASADFYVVVDFDCTGDPLPVECDSENILWKVRNRDCSSRATGSSVFDFEGDGAAEVVYADEENFRIFDGRTGAILFDDPTHSSNTRMEMPIVVDVDNDGKSEVVIPEPNTSSATLGGIEIWEDTDNNWVRTRRIWNQHAYHVTNITEDGQVPRDEEPNWRNGRLNNFRQNVQPGGLFDAPDLQVLAVELSGCVSSGILHIAVTVSNEGAVGVPPGISVTASATTDTGMTVDLGVQRTSLRLLPGQSEVIEFVWDTGGFTFATFTVTARVDDDGTGAGDYNECIEDNNEGTSEVLMICTFG